MKLFSRSSLLILSLLVLIAACLPFFISGYLTMNAIDEAVGRLNTQTGLSFSVRLDDVQKGVFDSRMTLRLRSRYNGAQISRVDLVLRHGFFSVDLLAKLADQGGQPLLLKSVTDNRSPQLRVSVNDFLPALWSSPLRGVISIPALLVDDGRQVLTLQSVKIAFSALQQDSGFNLNASLTDLSLQHKRLNSLQGKGMKLELESNAEQYRIHLELEKIETSHLQIKLAAQALSFILSYQPQQNGFSTDWQLQIPWAAHQGIPYFRMQDFELQARLDYALKQPDILQLDIKKNTRLDSNMGPLLIQLRAAQMASTQGQRMPLFRRLAELPLDIEASIPRALLDVLYTGEMRRWLDRGEMHEEILAVRWRATLSASEIFKHLPDDRP